MVIQNIDQQKGQEIKFIFVSAFLLTQFLFFIDEGYYDFRWMAEPSNWIIFVIYFGLIVMGQLTIAKLTGRFKFNLLKSWVIFFAGSGMMLWMAFRIFG